MRYLLAGSTSTAAADALLWHIGKKYGRALAGRTKELGKTADESMAILALAAQKSGWGRIILENRLQLDETIKVFFENCAFCEGLHGENSPSCYFLAGILSGIAQRLFGEEFSARETECRAVGGNSCVFSVAKFK
ncbi:MAG: V4R domain-containing protein [Candidatus Caldarchaeum sp.]